MEKEFVFLMAEGFSSDIEKPFESSSEYELEQENYAVPDCTGLQNVQPIPVSDSNDDDILNSVFERRWKKPTLSSKLPVFSNEVGPVWPHFLGIEIATDIFLTLVPEHIIKNLMFQNDLSIQQKQKRVKSIEIGEM